MLRRPLAGLAAAALRRVPSDGEWRPLAEGRRSGRAQAPGGPSWGVRPRARVSLYESAEKRQEPPLIACEGPPEPVLSAGVVDLPEGLLRLCS